MKQRPTKRRQANGTRMALYFLKRLEAGLLLDRTKETGRHKRQMVNAPKVLAN